MTPIILVGDAMTKPALLLACATIMALTIPEAFGYSAGAPVDVCGDMTPKHPAQPQPSKLPYVVKVDKSKVKKGESVAITISGTKGHENFLGFLVQVRNAAGTPVGTFNIRGDDKLSKAIDCSQPQVKMILFACNFWHTAFYSGDKENKPKQVGMYI